MTGTRRARADVGAVVRLGLVAVVAVSLVGCGGEADGPVVASSTTTTTHAAPTSTTTTVADTPPASASATTDGVELALNVEHGEVVAGTRVWADLLIRNVGASAVYWQAGGCAVPGSIEMAPAGGGSAPESGPPADGWDGAPAGFAGWVRQHNALTSTLPFRVAGQVGWLSVACTSDSRMTPLQPGEELRQRAAVDVRVAPGELAGDGAYVVTAGFRSYEKPDDYGYQETDHPRPTAVVSVPVRVRDDAQRSGADDAVGAFSTAVALGQFVERTRTAEVENSWTTTMSWWRGAWELLVTPYYGSEGEQSLRLRYDPRTQVISDARVIWNGQPPDDDPDGRRPPDDRPDDPMSTATR